MNKILRIPSILVALFLSSQALATPTDCFLVASGTYTGSNTTALIAAPRTARRVVYVQHVTAVSGTTPSMTSILRHSWSNAFPGTSNLTIAAASAVTTVGDHITHGVMSGKYVLPMGYWNINMSISGTTPSFTVDHYACYDERGE